MTDRPLTKSCRWTPYAVVVLTIAWIMAIAASVFWCFALGMEQWADGHTNGGVSRPGLEQDIDSAIRTLAGASLGGPLLISVVAFTGRMRKTGTVFAAIPVLVGLALAVLALASKQDLH